MDGLVTLGAGADYVRPDFRAPFQADYYLRAVPADATTKGFYLQAYVDEARQFGHHLEGYGPYRGFKDYTQLEGMKLQLECARLMHPEVPTREALRRLGWTVFPTLLGTMVGRVVFGAVGADMELVVKLSPRGFDVSVSHTRCEVLRNAPREAEIRVTHAFMFPDCYLVGVFEGGLAHYGHDAEVLIRRHGPHAVDYLARW